MLYAAFLNQRVTVNGFFPCLAVTLSSGRLGSGAQSRAKEQPPVCERSQGFCPAPSEAGDLAHECLLDLW